MSAWMDVGDNRLMMYRAIDLRYGLHVVGTMRMLQPK